MVWISTIRRPRPCADKSSRRNPFCADCIANGTRRSGARYRTYRVKYSSSVLQAGQERVAYAVMPEALRSDVFAGDGVEIVLDSRRIPAAEGSIRAIVMTNVFHHIPDVERFLNEAQRVLPAGGRIIMWEPWLTPWSHLIYRYVHHEPCDPEALAWAFPEGGPLSSANEALAWIVFARDAERFESVFPQLEVFELRLAMPLCYLLSGGISFRSIVPGAAYGSVRALEKLLSPLDRYLAMFAFLVVEKRT